MAKVGENVDYKVDGSKLVITIDISKRGSLSKSGKSISIATTNGNKEIAPGVVMGLNVYTPNK